MKKHFLLFIFSLLSSTFILAQQKGFLKGTIVDKTTNETLIGATITIENTNIGTVTDIDGNFGLEVVPGEHNFVVSYVGYQSQNFKAIRVQPNETVTLNVELSTAQNVLSEVVISTKIQKQSVGSLVALQQKSASFVTGISSDDMRRSPDRTTGDVLKRVSGTTIQDNKFVIIRGLADRYNTALINGLALPSTEPDRKSFAFDIFPANLLDNLIIYKTATPDLPGEFAGGVILLNTKEVPEDNFTTISVGSSYNAQSTFKSATTPLTYKGDWIGLGADARALPNTFPNNFKSLSDEEKAAYSKVVPNDWKTKNVASLRPTQNYQFSLARHYNMFGRQLGLIGGASYYNSPKIQFNERNEYNADASPISKYKDVMYKENTSVGALLNFAYNISPLNKIQFNNTYSITSDNQFFERSGTHLEQARYDKGYAFYYQSTQLIANQLIGEHSLPGGKLKTKWAVGHNYITRTIPGYRRILYTKSVDAASEDPYYAYVPNSFPSVTQSGRFYGDQAERDYTASVDFTLPYTFKGLRNNFKFGALTEFKNRTFDARNLGYVGRYNPTILALPYDQLFDSQNIGENGFRVVEATDKSDSYTASSALAAGYVMTEHQLLHNLRLVTGVRVESFHQKMNSYYINSTNEAKVNTNKTDFLPSINLTYNLTEKSNLRASASKTISRPNFRELAPFSFYDFLNDASVVGDPTIVRASIQNYDLKYELFPGANQSFSVSTFYKKFKNPIEMNAEIAGAGAKLFQFRNAVAAQNFGAEVEYRQRLTKLNDIWKPFEHFTWFSNLSYIYSEVDQSNLPGAIVRGLQGQSPYIINTGLSYQHPEAGFSATMMYNRIGRRVWAVGNNGYQHIYEAPRNVLDIQITQKVWKKKAEIKLNVSDIINNTAIFYQDIDHSGKFEAAKDTKILGSKYGQNVSLSFSYNF